MNKRLLNKKLDFDRVLLYLQKFTWLTSIRFPGSITVDRATD